MAVVAQQSVNLGNVPKIDHLMSSERDFPHRPEGASYRYVLCSTPRCGSNLVGDMLHGTGLAGDPNEYLNTRYIQGFMRWRGETAGRMQVEEYQAEMEKRRTSPNGVYGVKIHFEHLESLWGTNGTAMVEFLRRFDKFVILSRRDKIAQAVSLHKARETQIWSSLDYKFLAEDDPRRKVQAKFSGMRIARALSDLIEQETSWRGLLTRGQLPFIEVFYEDMVADYAGESRKLLAALGVDASNVQLEGPGLQKQGADNDPMIARFRRLIGVDAQERQA